MLDSKITKTISFLVLLINANFASATSQATNNLDEVFKCKFPNFGNNLFVINTIVMKKGATNTYLKCNPTSPFDFVNYTPTSPIDYSGTNTDNSETPPIVEVLGCKLLEDVTAGTFWVPDGSCYKTGGSGLSSAFKFCYSGGWSDGGSDEGALGELSDCLGDD